MLIVIVLAEREDGRLRDPRVIDHAQFVLTSAELHCSVILRPLVIIDERAGDAETKTECPISGFFLNGIVMNPVDTPPSIAYAAENLILDKI